MKWTEKHLRNLERLVEQGFQVVSFPLFGGSIGIQKCGCAALLQPGENGRLEMAASPSYLLEGNLSALVERTGKRWFVWKSLTVEATDERLAQLRRFEEELRDCLEPRQPV